MAFLYHKLNRRSLLSLILVWSTVSFWFLNSLPIARALVIAGGFLCFLFIWFEITPIFLLIFLSFTTSYALYGLLLQYSLPVWLLMLAIIIIFGYLFTYVEQKIGILGNKRLEYLIAFFLITLEVFLALSYYQIDPLGLSLIIATVCYLISGFCYTILAKRDNLRFSTYVWFATIVTALVLATSTWSI